jgi:hypothetical protein
VADELDPREAARARRRDRDAEAQHREPMNPGMGKVFKQIGDAQAKAAKLAGKRPKSPKAAKATRKGRPKSPTSVRRKRV